VKLTLREGRFFDRTDEDTHAAVCVIGDRVRRDLFGFEPALGRPKKAPDAGGPRPAGTSRNRSGTEGWSD